MLLFPSLNCFPTWVITSQLINSSSRRCLRWSGLTKATAKSPTFSIIHAAFTQHVLANYSPKSCSPISVRNRGPRRKTTREEDQLIIQKAREKAHAPVRAVLGELNSPTKRKMVRKWWEQRFDKTTSYSEWSKSTGKNVNKPGCTTVRNQAAPRSVSVKQLCATRPRPVQPASETWPARICVSRLPETLKLNYKPYKNHKVFVGFP